MLDDVGLVENNDDPEVEDVEEEEGDEDELEGRSRCSEE